MTPISVTRPFSTTPALTASAPELAAQSLQFTTDGQCKNKNVMAAVIDALTDQSRSDECIAAIYENACLHHYQAELNQIISRIETQHGSGTVVVNRNVLRLLADNQISLLQNSNGTVQFEKIIAFRRNVERHNLIQSTLDTILPTSLCQLISCFDDEIEIGEKNRNAIIEILESGDPTAKSALIAAASHQHQIPCLNGLFKEQLIAHKALNLSHVDISNLNLTGINFTQANLSYANLQNCCLVDAQLRDALFIASNLNNANLSRANLANAYLSQTRLVAANLYRANLRGAILNYACVLGANLEYADLGYSMDLSLTVLNFCNITNVAYVTLKSLSHKVLPPIDVIVVPKLSETSSHSDFCPGSGSTFGWVGPSTRREAIVIDETEKGLLLARGIVIKDNLDGTNQLHRGVAIRQDPLRRQAIDSSLTKILPTELTGIISSYEDDIEISQWNEGFIMEILTSTDQTAKALVLAAASHQFKIPYLNLRLMKLRERGFQLDFSHIDLSNLYLPGINLNHINLSHAVMHGCNLYQATLHHANLTKANLNGAALESTEFTNANMSAASLVHANLTGAILIQTKLVGAVLKFANLFKAELQGSDLSNAFLDHAALKWTDLTSAVMINTSLTHADLYCTKFSAANLSHAKLMHAKLVYATLMRVNLNHADLSDATVEDITLMYEPKLSGTIWKGVHAKKIFTDPVTRKLLPFLIRLQCR